MNEQVWLDTTFILQGSRSWDKLAVETSWVPWSDWNLFGAPCNAMNLLTAIKKVSVEYVSAISTCARDVDVHMEMTPHAFPVERLFTDPLMERGPNRSTDIDQKGGVGPIRCSGRGAIFCSPNFLARLLHEKQALLRRMPSGVPV